MAKAAWRHQSPQYHCGIVRRPLRGQGGQPWPECGNSASQPGASALGNDQPQRLAFAEWQQRVARDGSRSGGAAAGLKLLTREKEIMLNHLENNEPYSKNVMAELKEYREAIQQQLLPLARIDMVRLFHSKNIRPSSMIDISDGLSSDLQHICQQSKTGALIRERSIPVSSCTRRVADEMQDDALTWALTGGEDYQLLFTISKEEYQRIKDNTKISVIGEITDPEAGVHLVDIYGMNIDLASIRGFDHFSA